MESPLREREGEPKVDYTHNPNVVFDSVGGASMPRPSKLNPPHRRQIKASFIKLRHLLEVAKNFIVFLDRIPSVIH